jgi:hypothetical protein
MAWGSCVVNTDVPTIGCLEPIFSNVVSAVMSLAGVALFLMLVISGFNFLFAGGDQKKLEKAKGTLSGAMIGLVIIVVSYLILRAIGIFTGVTVTNFQVVFP